MAASGRRSPLSQRATVDLLTNTTYDQTAPADFFGTQSFHEDDYALFYNNVKENVAKRIEAYLAQHG